MLPRFKVLDCAISVKNCEKVENKIRPALACPNTNMYLVSLVIKSDHKSSL